MEQFPDATNHTNCLADTEMCRTELHSWKVIYAVVFESRKTLLDVDMVCTRFFLQVRGKGSQMVKPYLPMYPSLLVHLLLTIAYEAYVCPRSTSVHNLLMSSYCRLI